MFISNMVAPLLTRIMFMTVVQYGTVGYNIGMYSVVYWSLYPPADTQWTEK
jgi:hypothetical protein